MTEDTNPKKPAFNPNQAYEPVSDSKPAFDPNKPFDEVKKKTQSDSTVAQPKSVSETGNGSSAISEGNPFKSTEIPGQLPTSTNIAAKPAAKLASVKQVKPKTKKEDDYDFLDYLSEGLGVGVDYLAKSVAETPEMAYDMLKSEKFANSLDNIIPAVPAGTIARKALQFLDPAKDGKSTAEDIKKFYGIRNVPAEHLKERINTLNKSIEAQNQKYGGDALSAIQNERYIDAAKMIAGTTVQSLPIMAAAIMSGGSTAANTAIGLSTASQQYAKLKDENPELSTDAKLANAGVSGLLEATIGTFVEGASGQAMKRIIADKGAKEGAKIVANGFRDMFAKAVEKNPALNVLGEVIEESTVEFGNQLNDMNTGLRKEFNLHDIANAGLSAVGMGAATTVPVYGAKAYTTVKDYGQMKNANKQIFKLTNELNNPDVSETTKSEIKKNIDALVKHNQTIVQKGKENIKSLHPDVKEKLIESIAALETLKEKAQEIKDDNSSPETKKVLLSNLKKEAKEANIVKDKILKGEATVIDALSATEQEKIKFKAKKEIMDSLPASNELSDKQLDEALSEDKVLAKAIEIYEKEKPEKPKVEPIEPTVAETTEATLPPVPENYDIVSEPAIETTEQKITEPVQEIPTLEVEQPITPIVDETVQGTDNAIDGDIRPTAKPVGESPISGEEAIEAESPQPAVDSGESEGNVREPKAEVEKPKLNLDDMASFIEQTFLNTKPKKNETDKGTTKSSDAQDTGSRTEAKTAGKQKPTAVDKKNGQRQEKLLKISQKGKVPLTKRKFKGDRARASAIEPTNPREAVLKYFVDGGKIASDYVLNAFKGSKEELKSRSNGFHGIATKNAPDIDALAHKIWEANPNMSLRKIKNMIEEVVSSHTTWQSISDTILKSHGEKSIDSQEDFERHSEAYEEVKEERKQTPTDEEMEVMSSYLAQLSDEEIARMFEDNDMSFDDFLKDMERRQVTFDNGPFKGEKGTLHDDGTIVSEDGTVYTPENVSNVKATETEKAKPEPKKKTDNKNVSSKETFEMTSAEYDELRKKGENLLSHAKKMKYQYGTIDKAIKEGASKKDIDKWQEFVELNKTHNTSLVYKSMIQSAIYEGKPISKEVFKENPELVKKAELAIENGSFQERIAQGKITAENAVKIIENAGLQVPKSISEKLKSTAKIKKEKANSVVDKLAADLKKLLPSVNDPDLHTNGVTQDAVIDLIASAVKTLVGAGIDINEAISQVLDRMKEQFGDVDFINEEVIREKIEGKKKEEVKPEPKKEPEVKKEEPKKEEPKKQPAETTEDFERKQGKRSISTRASEGSFTTVKKAISKYSLDYDVENQEKAKENADMFVDEVGVQAAWNAVKTGQIQGAEKAFVYDKIIRDINKEIENAIGEEREDLEEMNTQILSEIMDEFAKEGTKAGQFISALGRIYTGSMGMYNLSKRVADYKAKNNGNIPDEVLAKFTKADAKIKELESKLDEVNKRKAELEDEQALTNIIEDISRQSKVGKNAQITSTTKAQAFADKLRSFKTSSLGGAMSATPVSLAYDGSIEVAARIIETSGKIADAIKAGIEHIRQQKLAKQEQAEAIGQLMNAFGQADGEQKSITIDDNGKLKIPKSLIREHVENGIDNVEDLVEAIKNDIAEIFPDEEFTDREVRDAITKYGKTVNPTVDDIQAEINRLNSLGRMISGMEDVLDGQRPQKSGLQRRELTPEERKMQRQLKEMMRDLPMDDADLAKTWKTALDSIKTRLENEIQDLEKQIEAGEKRKGERKTLELDDDAKALKETRDALRKTLDELVGKPELTYEEKVAKAIKHAEDAVAKLQEKIVSGDIAYKAKPTPVTSAKLEALRAQKKALESQMDQMRQDSGDAEMKRLQTAKQSRINRMKELKRRIEEKDFSTKKQKPLPVDAEILEIERQLLEQKAIFEKEKYKQELNDQHVFRKWWSRVGNVLGLPRLFKAGGEFSQVLMQMGFLTTEMLVKNPSQVFKGIAMLGKAFTSNATAQKYETMVKTHPLYPLMQKAKLTLTGTDHRIDATEEAFQLDLVNDTWNMIGEGLNKATGNKEILTPLGKLKKMLGKEVTDDDKRMAGDQFKDSNLWKMFERGAVTYSNHMKMLKFEEGAKELAKAGYDPINDFEQYKKLASYINIFSGRANLGKAEMISKDLAVVFFSARMAASQFQQLNPIFYASLADWSGVKGVTSLHKVKSTVAQKMALKSFITSFATITGFSLAFMAAANAASDDDDEKWTMETDPRSSDFGKLRKGKFTFDMWHGLGTWAVFFSRMISQQNKSRKTGEIKGLGEGFGSPTSGDLGIQFIGNKLAPTASFLWQLSLTHPKVDKKTGETYRVDKYGNIFGDDEISDLMKPIYWNAVNEIRKEDPDAWQSFLTAVGSLGANVGTDKDELKFKDLHKGERSSVGRQVSGRSGSGRQSFNRH